MQLPKELRTWPNAISAFRALAGPTVMVLITADTRTALFAALALMLAAEVSDLVDGIVARRSGGHTEFGNLVDPVCDSIYHLSVFLGFLANGWMPVWMLFAIYAADLTVPYLNTFARQAGQVLHARLSGRIETLVHAVCQIAIVATAAGLSGGLLSTGDSTIYALLSVATAASVLALIDYGAKAVRLTTP
jgi:CDP-diacylglycerol--glycerol-3-phosphate 3-phosphatidyltransferase